MEKQIKLQAFLEPLVGFLNNEIPKSVSQDFALVKAQEMVWWALKALTDEELSKKAGS